MRITVELDDDITSQIETLCKERQLEPETLLNEALRLGVLEMEAEATK